ncbi:FAD assembly factor SdhE [Psychrobacter sp. I-STPA10]|uniref:FAD assembly factor SdhE n=1 Tax=Psychrobacter sp. I-STPA10 TaxID=2585769 RepID=UPI001E2E18D4|nr:succinate dehydrogenase assembly factor 2 [Psychrobacter sp. I-STPA10]
MSDFQPTDEQRRIIYQARRGLKELDFYIDPYVKNHYLTADATEQATFAKLLSYEDPDLLNFFMNQDTPDDAQVAELIAKLKAYQHSPDSAH